MNQKPKIRRIFVFIICSVLQIYLITQSIGLLNLMLRRTDHWLGFLFGFAVIFAAIFAIIYALHQFKKSQDANSMKIAKSLWLSLRDEWEKS